MVSIVRRTIINFLLANFDSDSVKFYYRFWHNYIINYLMILFGTFVIQFKKKYLMILFAKITISILFSCRSIFACHLTTFCKKTICSTFVYLFSANAEFRLLDSASVKFHHRFWRHYLMILLTKLKFQNFISIFFSCRSIFTCHVKIVWKKTIF